MRILAAIAVVWSAALLAAHSRGAEERTAPADETATAEKAIRYDRDIRPLLSDRCFRCHGPDAAHREADLRLDVREQAVAPRDGTPAIVPGKPEGSELFRRIIATGDEQMPPADSNLSLSRAEMELLRRWIAEGAAYAPHWSFVPPRAEAVPTVKNQAWVRNPIDAFVLADLERRGLKPSPEATPETLLRRAALDLTGIPPTLAEVDAFFKARSPSLRSSAPLRGEGGEAEGRRDGGGDYGAFVDRLLASPRYGERMALDWLDAARYADTNGYYNDSERQAWPWRDWVIRAFNENKPFDRFTIEQLAGDLLPEATMDQRIATGFNRNHMVTNETGIIDEEYRVGYVVDRVDTTAATWLGLTIGCARCHDHKYDPVTQRDYYRLFAFFNNVAETGLVKDVAPLSPAPNVSLPTAEQDARLAKLAAERTTREAELKKLRPALAAALAQWEPTVLEKLPPMPTAGCEFHFPLEANGTDAGPHHLSSSLSGTLTGTTGVLGQAAAFDGTQYVEFAGGRGVERDRPFTLSVWIRPGSAPSGCVISKMDASAEARGFEIIWYKSQPRINLVHRWAADAIEVVAEEKFGGKQWRHLTVVYDGSSKAAGMRVFVDGRPVEIDVRRDTLTGSTATRDPWRIAWKATGVGFDGDVDELRFYDRALPTAEVETLYWRDLLAGTIATPKAERTRRQTEELEAYYIARHGTAEQRRLTEQVAALRRAEEEVRKSVLVASVMQETEKPRETHILMRGQYDQPGVKVEVGVPGALGSLASDSPRNRLGLARWLVSPANPLTARVAVNRYWRQVFGEGLVRTDADFGLQGEPPTHPELLDWLAVRFMESGWDVKALLKLMVTSATYRQSSAFTKALVERDPENRLLARGPRYRLPAELIRDQALSIGGLLVERIGGPSVKPYQPPGLWEAVSYNGEQTYVTDRGKGQYRRGLYTYWKRQSPPPSMLSFDGPTREVCTIRRPRTNTPLQALVLLNDPVYVEAARGLATRMMREANGDTAERVRFGFRTATGRRPSEVEAAVLTKLYEGRLAEYRGRPADAKSVVRVGDSPVDPKLDVDELAAWTAVAGVLLNLDETVTQH